MSATRHCPPSSEASNMSGSNHDWPLANMLIWLAQTKLNVLIRLLSADRTITGELYVRQGHTHAAFWRKHDGLELSGEKAAEQLLQCEDGEFWVFTGKEHAVEQNIALNSHQMLQKYMMRAVETEEIREELQSAGWAEAA